MWAMRRKGDTCLDGAHRLMTCYLALMGPTGVVHKVYVDEDGNQLQSRTLCGSLEVATHALVAVPTSRAARTCARCLKQLQQANLLGAGIEALRPGLRRVS